MHLFGNISRLKQDIMTGFTTLRETGEFITFFHQVTTGVASSYSKVSNQDRRTRTTRGVRLHDFGVANQLLQTL